jgi:hypothetical protein
MKAYRVIRTCTIGRRYLEKGAVVEYPDDVQVPRHLEPLKGAKLPKASKPDDGHSYSALQKKDAEAKKVKGGFGSSLHQDKTPKSGKSKKRK